MENNKVECEKIYVDQLSGAEREKIMKEVEKHNPRRSFPTVVLNDGSKVIIGYKPEEFEKELL
jgi:glutaredoxin-like protein NrdH